MPKGFPKSGVSDGRFKKGNKVAFAKKHRFPQTKEHKEKLSKTMMGNKNGIGNKANTGRKLSDEQRKQISIRNRDKYASRRIVKGIEHPWYIDGRTPENRKIRASVESKLWKNYCMERDNFTCQKTGQRGGNLEVHHILNFSKYPELRFDIDNGITLSKESHFEFHKKYGFRNNTKEQIEEFLGKKLFTI